jgi:glucokinase
MYASGPAIGGEAVFAAAARGEPAALEAVERAGRAIGETVASLCAVLPSEQLVVGGGVAAGLPLLRPAIENAFAERSAFIGPVEVVGAELGIEAGAIGAAFAAAEVRGEVRELDRTRA